MDLHNRYKCLGMIQTLPLPGSFRNRGQGFEEILEHALEETRVLSSCGFDGAIVQNMGDMPIRQKAAPEAIAFLAVITRKIKEEFPKFEVGVLVNWDAEASLAVAQASEADFVRVEHLYTGAEVTSCGILQAQAPELCAMRKRLDSRIPIFADIQEPHGVPLGAKNIRDAAWEAVNETFADGLFVSAPAVDGSIQMAKEARERTSVPIYLGGGANGENVYELLRYFDAVCVATWIKNGSLSNPIDPEKAKTFVGEVRRAQADGIRER